MDSEFIELIGFDKNVIYAIPEIRSLSGTGVVYTSAVAFSVDCQGLPDASQSGVVVFDGDSVTFPFHLHNALADVELTPSAPYCVCTMHSTDISFLATGSLSVVPTRLADGINGTIPSGPPATLIVGSTFPIVNSNGELVPSVSTTPPICPSNCGQAGCPSETSPPF